MRRIISFILAFVVLLGVFPAQAFGQETTPDTQVDTGDVTIEGTNGFGNLLSEAISEEQAETESAYDAGYTVTDLEIVDNVATVTYDAMEEAVLIVALYSEDGLQMLNSGKINVSPEETQATVTIEGTMPEYFMASAYLVDSYDYSPLCEAYDTPMYTREMQELLASTIHDYDPDRVLNLDEDETTNFAVYADTTKVIEYVEGKNKVASVDEETATYVIENADEQFTTLASGDVVAYAYGDDEILIVKVGAVTVNGTTVTLTGTDVEMCDIFDAVKVESIGNSGDMQVDTSELEEGVTYEGVEYDTDSNLPHAVEDDFVFEHANHKYFLDKEFEDYNKPETYLAKIKLKGELKLFVKAELSFYISTKWQYIRFQVDSGVELNGSISGSVSARTIPLGNYNIFPVSFVCVNLQPLIVFSFSSELEFALSWSSTIGFQSEHRSGGDRITKNLSSKPKIDAELKFEGSIFIGVDLNPGLYIISSKLLETKLNSEIGVEIKGTQKLSVDELLNPQEEIHTCSSCLDGDIYAVARVEVEINFMNSNNLAHKTKLLNLRVKIKDFYVSDDHDESGWGKCPYHIYRLTTSVADAEGNPISDATVTVGNLQEYTNSNGAAVVYLPVGSYAVTASSGELSKTGTIQVSGACKLAIKLGVQGEDGFSFEHESFGDINAGDIADYGYVVASGTCGAGVIWEYYSGGLLVISGSGDMKNFKSSQYDQPWSNYRRNILAVVIDEGVTSVGECAFYKCENLTNVSIADSVSSIGQLAFYRCYDLDEIVIPDGVTSIGFAAFCDCESLRSVTIPDGVTALETQLFQDCSSLTSVEIPDTVTSIGQYTFDGCSSLTDVTIPEKVTSIGYGAFLDCASLTGVTIPDGITSIQGSVFAGCGSLNNVTIPDSVTSIGEYAFSGCSSLSGVVIPDSVTVIGQCAFRRCYNLASVTLSDSITSLSNFMFSDCTGLPAIIIPEGVTSIGNEAFAGCSSLTSVTIPDSVTSIGEYAFYYCSSLPSVEIPDSVTTIKKSAFSDCSSLNSISIPYGVTTITEKMLADCTALTSVSIPDSVTSIGEDAFCGCSNLTEVELPDSITFIGNSAFSGCSSLTDVAIPYGVSIIRSYAFSSCTSLASVSIPDSVTKIYSGAFNKCSSLSSVTIPGSVTSIDNNAFQDCFSLREIIFQGNAPYISSGYTFYRVTATAYYPAENTTWTASKLQNYGGTITWVPYTLDENGDMVINEAAAVTVAPDTELPDLPAEKAEVKLTGLEAPEPDFGNREETLNPDAVFGGEYGTEVTDTFTLKTASFENLVPGGDYLLLALKSIDVDDPLAASNLLFVDQAAAGEDGTLAFTYVQRETADISYVVACGPSNKDLADAEILFPEMTADGEVQVVNPTVVYDGKTLTEGRDYVLTGTVSFTEGGSYTCYVRGIRNYTGMVACTYTVEASAEETLIKWYSGTTSLNGTIDLNIYVLLSENLANADDTYVRFTYADKVVDVPMADALHSPNEGNPNRYRFSCPIYAKQLADSVNVKFMRGEEMLGTELNYSVKQYCENQIKKSPDAELVALCKALLNYGAAAQQLLNYNTGNLANASLSDDDKVLPDVNASAYAYSVTGSEEGIKAKSATLMLEDVVKVRVYFTLTGDKSIDEYTITIDGKAVTPSYNEKGWYVETDGIPGKDLEKMFQVQVGGITVNYGALSFVNSKVGGSNALESNISKALYAYWQAAEELLG